MTTGCDPIRERLDRFVAGSLPAAERREVDDHLAGCAECRADVEAARFLAGPVAGLRREIAPPADLWTGIAPRLARGPRRLSVPLWVVAAAAILLVVATSAVTVALLRRPAAGGETAVTFESTEARYRETALEVDLLYRRTRDSLAPETRVVLERNLAVIERALAEARDALRTDPANRTLEAMVLAAYQRKIQFLERAATLDRES